MNQATQQFSSAGYIGLGVMGEPMCGHLAQKAGSVGLSKVIGFDHDNAPLKRLEASGVQASNSAAQLASVADIVMFCLPSGDHVVELVRGSGELLATARPEQVFIDLGTTPVSLTRELHREFAERGAHFADSPVTRTRQAAQSGTLSTLFGGTASLFEQVSPLLGCFCSDITHCGTTGTGQIVKQMNNMILFQTVVAIAEGLTTARAAGLKDDVFFDALSKGSGDSFALRNHGVKAMLPNEFPERAFSTRYALKDLSYAIELAADHGLTLQGAENVRSLFEQAIENGDGDRYFPVLMNSITSDNT